MTIDEYAVECGGLEDNSGPAVDPLEHAMVEHLVEFDTEMYRLKSRRKYKSLSYKHLERLMIELHGEYWQDAL
jgi:hypothetical protein